QQVIKLLKETADELRTTAHNLMPELLEQQGLEIAARTYCERISRTKSLRLDFFSYGALDRLDQSFALVIYRAIQELVHNAVKHAAPKRLTVMMTLINDSFSLTIEDDGLGIQAKESDGMGLLSMKSRIQQLGGEMLIETGLNSGTSISISFSQVNL